MVSSRDASEHASKKGQEKGAAVLFNATAPFFSPAAPIAAEENKLSRPIYWGLLQPN